MRRNKAPVIWNDKVQQKVLEGYAATGTLVGAADHAGCSYELIRQHGKKDLEFAEQLALAKAEFVSRLEHEAIQRAMGRKIPVFFKGQQVGERPEYSDRLMELALKTKAGWSERSEIDLNVSGGILLMPQQADSLEKWVKKHNGAVDADYEVED